MKKFTKLLTIAFAMTVFSSCAFAAPSNNASSQLDLTVPEFLNIIKEDSTVPAGEAAFDDTYTSITNISPALHADFTVINNKPGRAIYLQSVAPSEGTPAALYGTASDLNVVFVNMTNQPDATSVTSITAGGELNPAENANAIAFKITPTITPDSNSGAQPVSPNWDTSKKQLKYTITNGKYSMSYAIGTTALPNTFSTHDTNGTYRANLVLTEASL